jgi:hemerythrin-like domain-containing protein
MPIQIGQKKEADFSDPLGLLSDCHRRIEHFLGVLIRICQKRSGDTLAADERPALENALTYFRNAAPKHTADEEDSLFPRMRAAGGAATALECLARLEGDHETAGRDHAIVDELGMRWLQQGLLDGEPTLELTHALERLSRLYAQHIAIEDKELFPLAGRVLNAGDLAAVGAEMAERRGVATNAGSKTVR